MRSNIHGTVLNTIVAMLTALGNAVAGEIPVNEKEPAIEAQRSTKKLDFVIAPIPIVNPTLGEGLALAGIVLYKFDPQSPPSYSALGGAYTSTDSWGAGFLQKANFGADRWRLLGAVALGVVNYDLYVAPETNPALKIATEQQGTGGMIQALRRISAHLYAGLRYQLARVEFPTPNVPQDLIPDDGLNLDIAAAGLVGEWDSRDHTFWPSKGNYITFTNNYYREALGSDLNYETVDAALNHYGRGFRGGDVLAMRLALCATSTDTPFFNQCQFGAHRDLRGYAVGRYYNDAQYTMQAEYRLPHLWWRFGAVAFAGFGAVADSFGDLLNADVLASGGIGLRILASRDQRLNLSLDYAWGKDESGFYMYVGEAF